jgi:hypothetical protein
MIIPTTVLDRRADATDTWSREARRAALLAAELGVTLDDEALILCDVYDLRSLQTRLRQALAGERHYPQPAYGPAAVLTRASRTGHALAALRRIVR